MEDQAQELRDLMKKMNEVSKAKQNDKYERATEILSSKTQKFKGTQAEELEIMMEYFKNSKNKILRR